MGRSKIVLLLLLPPLLIPAAVVGLRRFENTKDTNFDVGGFKDGKPGERRAMRRLAQIVREGQTRGKVRVRWDVTILSPPSQRGITLCGVEFEVGEGRLTKYILLPRRKADEAVATQYENVDGSMLEAVAAQSGLAEDVVKHGAVLRRHGTVKLNAQSQLILQW